MFKTLKLLFSPKNKDIRKRVGFTLMALFVFVVGTTIPVPGTEGAISDLGIWDLYDAIAGGALKQFSIFALGVMPYISASIITSVLQMDIEISTCLLNPQPILSKDSANFAEYKIFIIISPRQTFFVHRLSQINTDF